MAYYFPTRMFGFLKREVDIERQTLDGGTAINGETDRVATDGGGRVFAEFAEGALVDRDIVMTWRAITALVEEGVTPVIVPFCDPRHQPARFPTLLSTHSDGSPFDDETLYETGGGLVGEASAGVALRATQLAFTGNLVGRSLMGGEWFAINHAVKGWRAYKVRRVVAQSGTGATVEFRPPLREAIAAGQAIDFANPRCLMVADERPGTALQWGRQTDAAIRFVESP